ncbi:peroxisome assembly protein 12 [Biomphalaria glabrata]|nr:peroxisome assembly protein 12-like [Biomphalaria glabrata]
MPTSSDDVPEWLKDHTYTISTLWADINNIGIHSIFILCLEMQEKGMHSCQVNDWLHLLKITFCYEKR